jgi:NADH dehydrogenase (ubiquinone) Fe-S protein 3
MKDISIFFVNSLVKKLPKYIKSFVYANEVLTISVNFMHIRKILLFLKKHSTTQYKVLVDMTAVDYLSKDFRFEVVYTLLSIRFNSRLIIKMVINELDTPESISTLYPSSN